MTLDELIKAKGYKKKQLAKMFGIAPDKLSVIIKYGKLYKKMQVFLKSEPNKTPSYVRKKSV